MIIIVGILLIGLILVLEENYYLKEELKEVYKNDK